MSSEGWGAVATGHPLTTEAAETILKAGGNAYDAVVAAGFMSCFAEPMLSSLGGGGFLVAKTADNQELAFDFFVNFPGLGDKPHIPQMDEICVNFSSTTQSFLVGPGSIAVPGALKGFIHIHQRLGSMPLADVLFPTIQAAREGVRMNEVQTYVLELLHPIARFSKEGQNIYFKNEQLLTVGDNYRNPQLADFLENVITDKGEEFYKGEIASKLINKISDESLLNLKDLYTYEVVERKPFRGKYRQWNLLTNPLPSLGGALICLLLESAEKYHWKPNNWGSIEHLSSLAKIMQELEDKKSGGLLEKSFNISLTKGTTHISVADSKDNYASLSISNGEGSGIFVPETGVMLNNMLGEDDLTDINSDSLDPGQRVASMMSPCILENYQSKESLVIGSGGSKRIRSSLMQVITNLVDFEMDLEQAISSPRINWDGQALQMEPGWSEDVIKQLGELLNINLWSDQEFYFGGAHGVQPNLAAQGDPRRGGASCLVKEFFKN